MKIAKDLGVTAFATAFAIGALGIGVTLPAQAAAPGDPVWKACASTDLSTTLPPQEEHCNGSTITVMPDGKTVKFHSEKAGDTANIEALVFPVPLTEGDTITFKYQAPTEDWCGGGAPRVYVTLGGEVYNTSLAEKPCGVEEGGWMKVTYTLPAGADGTPAHTESNGWSVAAAGVVFDNGKTGRVDVTDVVIGGHEVDFNEKFPSPSATPSTSVTPSPASPTQSRTPGGPVATTTAPSLPVTGDRTGAFVGIGALAVLLGGAILVIGARRKRNRFQA